MLVLKILTHLNVFYFWEFSLWMLKPILNMGLLQIWLQKCEHLAATYQTELSGSIPIPKCLHFWSQISANICIKLIVFHSILFCIDFNAYANYLIIRQSNAIYKVIFIILGQLAVTLDQTYLDLRIGLNWSKETVSPHCSTVSRHVTEKKETNAGCSKGLWIQMLGGEAIPV